MSEKKLEIFGWVGTALSIIMYVSYIPQIIHNLNGIKGTPIQPFAAARDMGAACRGAGRGSPTAVGVRERCAHIVGRAVIGL